ncbi:MAG: TPM domain-containing protein [Oscillospiraceae bacterium]|nr:TPM domain-containing protein [Oscillospiraceae bacterium]
MNTSGTCPYCGYDPAATAGKYPLALRPGSILNGRYILGHVLGQGGFGITYLAWDDNMKERVAIKEYLPTDFAGRSAGSPSVLVYSGEREENFAYGKAQFLEEAKTLASFIGNAGIVRIYNYFEENGTAYFCMEYVDGPPLNKYMAAKGGRLTPEETNSLLLPLMGSLSVVHARGIVHRDIAPDNILVTADGRAKLIDFGAARYSTGEKSKSLDVILKHGFAPYEQYMRRGRQGPWTDVYAMAATWYYAVTGRVPPEAIERREEDTLAPPSALGIKLSRETEAVLLHGLEVFSNERWQNMDEFRRAMLKASSSQSVREIRVPPVADTVFASESALASVAKSEPAKKKSKLLVIVGTVAVLATMIFTVTRHWDNEDVAVRETSTPASVGTEAPMVVATSEPEVTEIEAKLDYVNDFAGILSAETRDVLNQRAAQVSQQYGFPVYVVVVDDMKNYVNGNIEYFAEEIFRTYELGAGESGDGVLLAMSMAERDYDICAHGDFGNYAFTDYGKGQLADTFLDNFRANDWTGGFADYIDNCGILISRAKNGDPLDVWIPDP